MLSEMNLLAWSNVTEVKWICYTRQNVQEPFFEVGNFEILGFGGDEYVEMLQMLARMNLLA